jgi:hypothetical protein
MSEEKIIIRVTRVSISKVKLKGSLSVKEQAQEGPTRGADQGKSQQTRRGDCEVECWVWVWHTVNTRTQVTEMMLKWFGRGG